MTCLSAGKIPKNETVQSEKKGLQREELNWTWVAQTLVYLTPVLQEQVSTAGQVSTRLLGRFDLLSPLCEPHWISSPLSQSPAAPCTHHPLMGNEHYRHPEGMQTLWPLVLAFTAPIPRGLQAASSPESQG